MLFLSDGIKQQQDEGVDVVVMKYLDSLFHYLATVASHKEQQITVLLPPSTTNNRQSRYSSHSRYHTVGQSSPGHHSSQHERRSLHSTPNLQKRSSVPSTLAPVCYNSDVACVEGTRSCSGHGYCYNKYAPKGERERASGECFACKCLETVIRKEDGSTRKVNWGGPACEKRDISTTFFQISAITIMFSVAIIGAVGMLFSVGQEKLPSVIGAGVAPVRPQK